jgi:protein-tyrosine phosphatase
MHETYIEFVRSPAARATFADLLNRLAVANTPRVFHCTAGKDRTGWAAALLHTIVGVDQATVLADYLLTNAHPTSPHHLYLRRIVRNIQPELEIYLASVDAQATNLLVGLDTAEAEYGSVILYALHGLGLAPTTLGALCARLTTA